MAIAVNGWIYNACRSDKDILIKVSRDQGYSWQDFIRLGDNDGIYGRPSIVVAGEAGNLHLFVAGTRTSAQSNLSSLFVRRYDALTGAFEAEPFTKSETGRVLACDLATDYTGGSRNTTGFSIALLYAVAPATGGSRLEETISADGGQSFGVRYTVAQSNYKIHNISIAYGKSTRASNGRYFMAWDEYTAAAAGRVYATRTAAGVLSAPAPAQRIDHLDAATEGRSRKPVIAVSTGADNDSSSCTALILMEAQNGNGHTDIYQANNHRAHFSNYWQTKKLASSASGPSVAFDGIAHVFAAGYYATGNQNLSLLKADCNRSGDWQTISHSYADRNLAADPGAVLVADPAQGGIAMSWKATGAGSGICFDAEYNTISAVLDLAGDTRDNELMQLYPNPATQELNVCLQQAPVTGQARLSLFDASGRLVQQVRVSSVVTRLDVRSLATGNYFAVYEDGRSRYTHRFSRR